MEKTTKETKGKKMEKMGGCCRESKEEPSCCESEDSCCNSGGCSQ